MSDQRLTEDELLDRLKTGGHRLTLQRRLICRVLADSDTDHLAATDIVNQAEAPDGALDLSTVYRTLEVMETLGVLHHVHLGHGPGIYHLSKVADHHHLVCQRCGGVTDVPLTEAGTGVEALATQHGFGVDDLHFAILGRHEDCPL